MHKTQSYCTTPIKNSSFIQNTNSLQFEVHVTYLKKSIWLEWGKWDLGNKTILVKGRIHLRSFDAN